MSSTPSPSGLTHICAALDVPRNLLQFLLVTLGPVWNHRHPQQRWGRRRAPLLPLLVGTLVYLRDGTTFRRAAARAGTSRSLPHQHFAEIVALVADLGVCQADGTLLTPGLLLEWLAEMKAAGEVVLIDGTFTRCPRPGACWSAQRPFYDSKHHAHTVNTQVLTTGTGDILGVHGGWPGAVPEPDQLRFSWFTPALLSSAVMVVGDRGFRGARKDVGVTCAAGNHRTPKPGDAEITLARAENERPNSLLKSWRVMDRTHLGRVVLLDTVTRAVAALVGLKTYGYRHPAWGA